MIPIALAVGFAEAEATGVGARANADDADAVATDEDGEVDAATGAGLDRERTAKKAIATAAQNKAPAMIHVRCGLIGGADDAWLCDTPSGGREATVAAEPDK